jgi:ComF family protein
MHTSTFDIRNLNMPVLPNLLKPLTNFVFPPVCAVCGGKLENLETPICDACWQALEADDGPAFDPESRDYTFSQIQAVWKFSEAFQKVIHFLKYDHKRSVGRKMGALMAGAVEKAYFNGVDRLVPVPVHHTRRRERGYNQAEVIGRALSEKAGIALDTGALKRVRKTGTQTKLTKRSRGKNISGAFMARGDFKGGTVMIVDDVFTTGATVNECARALKAAGAEEVRVLTAARA